MNVAGCQLRRDALTYLPKRGFILECAECNDLTKRWQDTGNSYASIQRAFKRAGLRRKGKLTHEIRRAVASTMLLNGTPIHVLKEILGHSTIKTTDLYAFTNEEAKREGSKNALI
jgi:site-specific recombinase XerD